MPEAPAPPKGVLLDVGGVLLPTPWELLEEFEARNGWPAGTLPWRGPLDPSTDPLWRSARAGRLPPGGYFERRAEEISRLLGARRTWPEITQAIFETPDGLAVRPQGRALVTDARAAGLRTGILTSKLVAFLSRAVVERSPFLGSFDVLLDESETGVAKPDPRAYAEAATAMGVEPDRELPEEGSELDLVGTLERDTFGGMDRLRLRVIDYAETAVSPLLARRLPVPELARAG